MEQRGAWGGRAEVCAVRWQPGGVSAAAASGAGMGENVVAVPVLELALGLAPCVVLGVRTALPLLPPQPASKHSTGMS